MDKATETNMIELAAEIIKNRDLGKAFARRTRVGKRYFGPMPVAKKIYKDLDSAEATSFIFGWLSALNSAEIHFSPDTGLVTGFTDNTGRLRNNF